MQHRAEPEPTVDPRADLHQVSRKLIEWGDNSGSLPLGTEAWLNSEDQHRPLIVRSFHAAAVNATLGAMLIAVATLSGSSRGWFHNPSGFYLWPPAAYLAIGVGFVLVGLTLAWKQRRALVIDFAGKKLSSSWWRAAGVSELDSSLVTAVQMLSTKVDVSLSARKAAATQVNLVIDQDAFEKQMALSDSLNQPATMLGASLNGGALLFHAASRYGQFLSRKSGHPGGRVPDRRLPVALARDNEGAERLAQKLAAELDVPLLDHRESKPG